MAARLRAFARRIGARRLILSARLRTTVLLRRAARAFARRAPGPARRWIERRQWLWQPVYGAGWLDRHYRQTDPFQVTSNPYEQSKYDHELAALGDRRFARALEVGCSVGVFTQRLAPRCDELIAVDISAGAIEQATRRVGEIAGVRLEQRMLPNDMPAGPFDLIVCSDVLYYWPEDVLLEAMKSFRGALAADGTFLALSYLGNIDHATPGARVHDLLRERLGLEHELGETVPDVGPSGAGYRLDVFRNRAAASSDGSRDDVAVREVDLRAAAPRQTGDRTPEASQSSSTTR